MNQHVSNVEFVGYPGEFISQSTPFVASAVPVASRPGLMITSTVR